MKYSTTQPDPLAAKEVAALLSRSVKWVRRQCVAGKIRVLPVGTPYRIPASEAERLLKPANHV